MATKIEARESGYWIVDTVTGKKEGPYTILCWKSLDHRSTSEARRLKKEMDRIEGLVQVAMLAPLWAMTLAWILGVYG